MYYDDPPLGQIDRKKRYSALTPAARITFAHFSV
jgi:hypothetical protein